MHAVLHESSGVIVDPVPRPFTQQDGVVAPLFKKTLGTVIASTHIKTSASRGTVQIFNFGKDMGHRGGTKRA